MLWDDCKAADQLQAEDPDDQFARRTLLRTFIALVEGEVWSRQQLAVEWAADRGVKLDPGELLIARDQKTKLENGTVKTTKAKGGGIGLRERVQFSFKLVAKAWGLKFKLEKDKAGWQSFTAVIDIRNRITHPKSPRDMRVEDAELRDIRESIWWWMTESQRIAGLINSA